MRAQYSTLSRPASSRSRSRNHRLVRAQSGFVTMRLWLPPPSIEACTRLGREDPDERLASTDRHHQERTADETSTGPNHHAPQPAERRVPATSRSDWLVGAFPQRGGPHGSLERRSLEDRDVRLARLRPRRLRACRHARHEEHRPEHARGRASPAASTRSCDAGFKQPAGESVLIQSRSLRASRSRLHCRHRGRRRRDLQAGRRAERPLAARLPAMPARSRRTGTRPSSRSRSAATPTRPSTRSTPSSTGSPTRSGPTRSSSSASSATRARTRRIETAYGDDLAKAGLLSLPVTAGHPRDRVRRARGRGHPAAPGADRCHSRRSD